MHFHRLFPCLIPDQLDGIRKRHPSGSSPKNMMEYIQLPDDYETRSSVPGKKRVSSRIDILLSIKSNILDLLIFTARIRSMGW